MPENSGNARHMVAGPRHIGMELLANGRRDRWAQTPDTGVTGGMVQILMNHGQGALKEPVILHALTVLYLLGEEDRCKAIDNDLREMLKEVRP
jgi:hypothetical protein